MNVLSGLTAHLSAAIVFPVLTAAGVLCFFAYYAAAMLPRRGTLEWIARAEQRARRGHFSFTAPLHPMEKKDALPLLLLTAVYAATAFWSLGDTSAPQRFLALESGESVSFSLEQPASLGRIEYYTGLFTGTYTLEYSLDSVAWQSVELEQDYAHLFYWREPELPEERQARFFRLTASTGYDQIELGELALFDESGARLTPVCGDGSALLFDEQELVPDAPHWTNSAYFDEIYHARTALEHIRGVYPYENSHPPLGKLIIGLGIRLFGMTPFGWRFMGTLCGVLMVPLLYWFLKNLFGKTPVALCGAALFTFDFMHLVQTRIATIDSYGVFFILAMFFFLYRFLALPPGTSFRKCALPLFLSGLMFGLGAASKWIVIYGGVGLAVLFFLGLWWKLRDWPAGERAPGRAVWLVGVLLWCVLCFVLIPLAVYLASYLPMAAADAKVTDGKSFLRLVWDNQVFMLTYHQGVDTPHPYSSRWYQWLFDVRPILYYMTNETGFTTRFASWNNPLVSWGGLAALAATAVQAVRRRCGKGLFLVVACLAQFLPWVFISRITFAYHYFPTILFLSMALAYVMNDLAESGRRWKPAVYGFTAGAAGLYALFYPALVGIRVPTWFMRVFIKWFPTWPF